MELTRIMELPETLQTPVTVVQQTNSTLITALAFTFFGLVLVIHTRLQRQAAKRQSEQSNATLSAMGEKIGAIETRMVHIDRSLERLVQRFDQIQLAQSNKEGFQHAMHLAKDGASTKQLVDLCGLTRGEAELFQRLHS